jgi:hypothetical protein
MKIAPKEGEETAGERGSVRLQRKGVRAYREDGAMALGAGLQTPRNGDVGQRCWEAPSAKEERRREGTGRTSESERGRALPASARAGKVPGRFMLG